MSQMNHFWPVKGFEDAPTRKRLAYFRPWIEDKKICITTPDPRIEAYVRTLAESIVAKEEAEVVLFAGAPAEDARAAFEWSKEHGKAFAGWSEGISESDLRQSRVWPFAVSADEHDGEPVLSHPGQLDLPKHPRVGIAIPTHAHAQAAVEAIASIAAEYPGFARFVVVANGVKPTDLSILARVEEDHPDFIKVLPFEENLGYGRGCNAGLAELMKDESLDFIGVMNDDVLPGTDCLFEMVHGFRQLEEMGLKPGAIGPLSNEISGAQRVELRPFKDIESMRGRAQEFWLANHSSASQAVQVRGLLLLWSRACLEAVGGFDPRFGIGNFEDDDHNLRTRLAGFTLWICSGAFLFHHGSSTFKTLQVDYEANIRRNAETLMRKWRLERLEDWVALADIPSGASLFQPFEFEPEKAHVVKINGEVVDLIQQASDIEFAAWVMGQPQVRTAEGRQALVELLSKAAA